jgi:methionyl-tRNA formyltransferase
MQLEMQPDIGALLVRKGLTALAGEAKAEPLRQGRNVEMRYGITVQGNNLSTIALLRSLIADGLAPDLLITLAPEARARVSIAGASGDLARWTREQGIEVYECDGYRLSSERDRQFFAENEFEIGVCTDWQHLIPAHVLEVFEQGMFGFHGSLMEFPNGRGRSPFNWSLRLGARAVYNNCFRYTAGADDGPVFNTTEIPIHPNDTIRTLQFKALIDYRVTIRRLLESYRAGDIELLPQPAGASVWLPRLTPEDSQLQFQAMSLTAILDMIRASSRPFAGAYATSGDDDRVTIWRATRYDGPIDPAWMNALVGEVLAAEMDSAVIKCRGGLLLATELSPFEQARSGQRYL